MSNHHAATGYHLEPLTAHHAVDLAAWRYPPPYDFYDWDPADDPLLLAAPAACMFAVLDTTGALAGFVCYGRAARVPGGEQAGVYEEPLLDIGLGLRPELTGQGRGARLVSAALDEGMRRFDPPGFRLTVAAFNERARRVYARAGFIPGPTCESLVRGQLVSFLIMTRGLASQPPQDEPATAQQQRGPSGS